MARTLVVVSSSFPIVGDGSEAAGSFVADLVHELARHRPVRVVAPGRMASSEPWNENIQVLRFASPDRPLSTLRPWRPADLYWLFKVWRGGQVAVNQASQGDAQHILALWGLPCGAWARRAARRNRLDYSVWLLGSDVWSLGRIPLAQGVLARVIRHARKAWADGYALAAQAQGMAGSEVGFLPSTRKIETVNPPPPRAQPPYRLLFLGRWHPNKGIDLLLDALAMLDDGDWQRIEKVEIHGGGPLHARVHSRVQQLRTAGRPVEVGGFLAKADAEAAIVRADWVLLPSRIESIPLVFSDAMKLGRPMLATPTGDLPALFEKAAFGVLTSAPDPASLLDGLRRVLRQPATLFAGALREHAATFDAAAVAARVESECSR